MRIENNSFRQTESVVEALEALSILGVNVHDFCVAPEVDDGVVTVGVNLSFPEDKNPLEKVEQLEA